MKAITVLLTVMAFVILWRGETTNASSLMIPLSQYRDVQAAWGGGLSSSDTSHWVASAGTWFDSAFHDSEILPQALKVSWELWAVGGEFCLDEIPPCDVYWGDAWSSYEVTFYLSESTTVYLRGGVSLGGTSTGTFTLRLSDQSGLYVFEITSPGSYDSEYVLPEGQYTFRTEGNVTGWPFTGQIEEQVEQMSVSLSFCLSKPVSDVTGDCKVDFRDFAVMASEWLNCGSDRPDGWGFIPQGSVTVDGDISEWTASIWWPLDIAYWRSPTDVPSARFALKWNDTTQKVYVAVEVTDSNHVFSDSYISWDASDRLEIYCQGNPVRGTGWGGIYNVAQQYYVAPNTTGGRWATWAYGETLASDVGLEYATRVTGDKIVYEAAVPVFENYGGFNGTQTVVKTLTAGTEIGFDVVVCTRHAIGFGMLSGNELRGKSGDASKFARYKLR